MHTFRDPQGFQDPVDEELASGTLAARLNVLLELAVIGDLQPRGEDFSELRDVHVDWKHLRYGCELEELYDSLDTSTQRDLKIITSRRTEYVGYAPDGPS